MKNSERGYYTVVPIQIVEERESYKINLHNLSEILKQDKAIDKIIKVSIMWKSTKVGVAEILINECSVLELRWIEIYEGYRMKGYFRNAVNTLKQLNLPIIGDIADEDEYLVKAYESVGAYVKHWSFLIEPIK